MYLCIRNTKEVFDNLELKINLNIVQRGMSPILYE